jgi:Protein of unknown function (DUF3667)
MANNNELKKIDKKNQEVSKYDFIICPNCGAEEVGKFCPNCGQSNKDFNKPIKEIFGDLLDSINLDIRLVNSLLPFFTKPGYLTEEYFKGKRKKYVPPMRMYILFSVLFFFLAQFTDLNEFKGLGNVSVDSVDSLNQNATALISETNEMLINEGLNDYLIQDTTKSRIIKPAETDTSDYITFGNLTPEYREELIEDFKSDTTLSDVEKRTAIGALKITENMNIFWAKFLKNISYVLFLLMPFFALILAMTLWKSKKLYVHHLIFSINFHSFIFAFSSILIILGMILPEKVYNYSGAALLLVPLYLMFGIRNFYKKSYVKSFFKTLGILFLYFFIILIVISLIIVFTAQGFSEL